MDVEKSVSQSSATLCAQSASEATQLEQPIKSATFDNLVPIPQLVEALHEMGLHTPTSVQIASLPISLSGRDVVAQAPTGSGKTLAFAIPLLAKIFNLTEQLRQDYREKGDTYALVLTPTRELAQQISSVVIGLKTPIAPTTVIGGESFSSQEGSLSRDSLVVIGTPGRVLDLIKQKKLRLKRCRYFVLDEADEMLSRGFLEDVRAILSRLPDERQGLFVSATISPRVEMLAESFLSKYQRIDAGKSDDAETSTVEHFYCEVGGELMAKPAALCDIIETFRPPSAIIFCNTKSDTHLIEAVLRKRGFDARRINSDLSQSRRSWLMEKLRSGELRFLVATDIAARGIDISELDLIINYSIHEQAEMYVHRTGRTGRAGRQGKAISLVGPKDFGAFHFLTKVTNFTFHKIPLPSDEDVVNAKLAHVYEILRTAHVELKERELLLAKKLLTEMNVSAELNDDLLQIVGKLTKYVIEHRLNVETKSLDEEDDQRQDRSTAAEHQSNHGDSAGRQDRRRGKRDRREREGASRQTRESNRPSESHTPSRQTDRNKGHHERQGRERRHQQDRPNSERYARTNRPESSSNRASSDRVSADPVRLTSHELSNELRLYVSQGSDDGMTADVFRQLATEFAGLNYDELIGTSFRKSHGFIDLKGEHAQLLLDNLHGIEYNGKLLNLEVANVISPREKSRPASFEESTESNAG